jgi:hypothetical protein
MTALARSLLVVGLVALCPAAPAEPPQRLALPRFTEEREAAALHFVGKHCPELVPLLENLKKVSRATYELQVRETFQVTELLADLQDDQKRYDLELRMWKAENQALVLVAKLAAPRDDDRKAAEDQLQVLARDLVDLEVQSLEHRAGLLQVELAAAKEELAKFRDNFDRAVKDRFDSLLEKARKKKP